ncbi:MAG TPA: alpha/beta fold hydrolase [Burkholderiales bacterium]|nr:alpha/beta fold hydrolase [Burkholderiales bacterium]
MNRGPWINHFVDNFLWSNAALIIKGMAPYGVVALEEIDRVCEKLRARETEPDRGKAWKEEWSSMGALLEKRGDDALAKGHKSTAGDYYLRAGIYHYNAERFIQPGPEKREQGARAYKVWHQGIRLRYPKIEFIEVPYEKTTLPALFMPAQERAGPRPTVVVVNGMDNAKEMSIFFCGLEFSRRGFNTLCLDGPGMGEVRRMRDVPSRYDYEVPGTAALEYLLTRKDVDRKRIAIMGYSFGGYYSSRIAAFEKRYAACIALSALHWDLAAWQTKIKDANKNAPKSVAQSNFQWRWVAGAADEDEGIEIARKFSLKDVAKNITCPFLVTHAGNDRVVPVENAQKLYDAVGSKNKTIKIFTTEEGGAEHAHVDNRAVGVQFAADWLEDNLPRG